MAFLSKFLPYSCYDLGHTWTPFCNKAAMDIGLSCFEEGLKIYASIYTLTSLLNGKPNWNRVKATLISILRSSLFLGLNGFFYIRCFCIFRKAFGGFGHYTTSFLPAIFANFLAILIEKKSRRATLAIYVANVACETLYNMFVSRGLITPMPYGKIILFSLTLGGLLRWYYTTRDTKNLQYTMLRAIFGDHERMCLISRKPLVYNTDIAHNIYANSLDAKHPLCPHDKGCLSNLIQMMAKRFAYGWGFHSIIAIFLSIPVILRNPRKLGFLLSSNKHLKFGAFLASLAGIYQTVHCLLRRIRRCNSLQHSTVAGLLAGVSIQFYPNTSAILYLLWKTLEATYYQGKEGWLGWMPSIPGFPIILYSLATSVLFHACVLEPHNLKPAYWKFVMRLTDKRMAEMNRSLLETMGTNSSKILPMFRPSYNFNHVSDSLKLLYGKN